MRFHYMSDLHLESEDWDGALPQGEVLIVAGDLGHARCLVAASDDGYARTQRERLLRFADRVTARFDRVLMVMGNHDHYDGVFEDTPHLIRDHLPGITLLDNEAVEIDGISIFGTTLWSDYDGGDPDAMKRANKGCGEFFFVKKRVCDESGNETLARFRAADALAAHGRAVESLKAFLEGANRDKSLVISHHPPCAAGLNPVHVGNGLDGAYASNLDGLIVEAGPAAWVHGHTHIQRQYRIGRTDFYSNCRGFVGRDQTADKFSAQKSLFL